MKLDGESAYHSNSTSNELASRLMRRSDNQLNMIMLENEAMHEERHDLTANIQKKGYQDIVSLYGETADSTSEKHDKNEYTEAPYTAPEKDGTIGTDTLLFADKTVAQIKVQEIMVCFQGSDCQVVKDICVDDGLHSFERNLLESTEVSESMPPGFKISEANANDDLSQQMTDGAALVEVDLKFTSVVDNHAKDQNSSLGLFEAKQNLDESNWIAANTSEKKITLQELFSLGEFDTRAQQMVPTSHGSISDHKQSFDQKKIEQVTLERESLVNLRLTSRMTDECSTFLENPNGGMSKGNSERNRSAATCVPFDVTFSNQNGYDMVNPPNDHLEGVCSSDFKSGAAAAVTSVTEENSINTDDQRLVNVHYHSLNEEMVFDVTTDNARSTSHHTNHGDLHFSGPSYLSGPKVSSGHIAYSGSISLRSDGSTTSTRSFAFPILQTEWNTSPVRMAQADRRHLRKNWWRVSLFCCKS